MKGPKPPIKRIKILKLVDKAKYNPVCIQETYQICTDSKRLKIKVLEKIYQAHKNKKTIRRLNLDIRERRIEQDYICSLLLAWQAHF